MQYPKPDFSFIDPVFFCFIFLLLLYMFFSGFRYPYWIAYFGPDIAPHCLELACIVQHFPSSRIMVVGSNLWSHPTGGFPRDCLSSSCWSFPESLSSPHQASFYGR